MARPVATLPKEARASFKDPLGPVFTDAQELLEEAGSPIIAVGDVVTSHLGNAGVTPDVAVVDGKTERETIDETVSAGLPETDREVRVESEPATISAELLAALVEAIESPDSVTITVEGEEDLATLPAVLRAPIDATVVYGQPGEGMVCVAVTSATKERVRDLVGELEVEAEFWDLLGETGA